MPFAPINPETGKSTPFETPSQVIFGSVAAILYIPLLFSVIAGPAKLIDWLLDSLQKQLPAEAVRSIFVCFVVSVAFGLYRLRLKHRFYGWVELFIGVLLAWEAAELNGWIPINSLQVVGAVYFITSGMTNLKEAKDQSVKAAKPVVINCGA